MSRPNAVRETPLDTGSAAARLLHRLARNVLLAFVDVAMLSLAGALAYFTWAAPIHQQSPGMYLELAPLVLLFVAGYARAGLYPSLGLGPVETLRRASLVTTFGFLVLAAFSFVLQLPHLYSRVTFGLALVLSLLFVPLGRVALFYLARTWHWWAEPVAIIGTGRRASRVMRDIRRASHLGYRPTAAVRCGDPGPAGAEFEGVPVVGGLEQVPRLAACGIRVAFLEVEQMQTGPILDRLQQSFHRVILLQEFDDLPVEGLQVRNLATLVGIEYTNNLLRPVNQTAKRFLDLVLGMAAFVVLSPVILVAALAVLLIDGRPVFFHQSRIGRAARRINVPKIRTMRRNADSELEEHLDANPALRDEWRLRFKLSEDPRLIPVVGRFFRRFSIDELPQLWAVIRGDMSLVGPRPFPDYHVEQFTARFSELRQSVRPGITGWWQIAVRSDGGIKEQEAFDTYYIRNWSVWFDLYVLGRTVMAVASGRGAY
jgi:Undecaprenyl-phosphate galactose phosphotransferase WbaP